MSMISIPFLTLNVLNDWFEMNVQQITCSLMFFSVAVLMSELMLAIDSVSRLLNWSPDLAGTDEGSPASRASGEEDVEMLDMEELDGGL